MKIVHEFDHGYIALLLKSALGGIEKQSVSRHRFPEIQLKSALGGIENLLQLGIKPTLLTARQAASKRKSDSQLIREILDRRHQVSIILS